MNTPLTLCACTPETSNEITASSALFNRSDVAVVAIGPASCLRHLYFQAMRVQALEQLYLCCITQREYAVGHVRTKVRKYLNQVLKEGTFRAILVYGTCADILMQIDFEEILAEVENTKNIPIKIFCRGPLEKRKMPAPKRLRMLFEELDQEITDSKSEPGCPKEFFLPPLAPDFAGVSSMLHDWACELILYTPAGCRTGLQLDEAFHRPPNFYYTDYNDIHAALGSEQQLINLLRQSPNSPRRAWRALVGTPVPHITGSDLDRVAQELSSREDPLVCFPCNGFEPYTRGIENALLTLGKEFLSPQKRVEKQILILGCSAMEAVSKDSLKSMLKQVEQLGYSYCFWGEGNPEDVQRATASSLCWCVSPTGEMLAKWLEHTVQMPWFTHLPAGRSGVRRFMRILEIQSTPDFQKEREAPVIDVNAEGPRVLIISDPLSGLGIQQSLYEDFSYSNTTVAVYSLAEMSTRFERDVFGRPIVYFKNLEEIKTLMCSANILVADPLYEMAAKHWGMQQLFIPVPYPALSGTLFSQLPVTLIGEDGYQYFASILGDKKRMEKKQ